MEKIIRHLKKPLVGLEKMPLGTEHLKENFSLKNSRHSYLVLLCGLLSFTILTVVFLTVHPEFNPLVPAAYNLSAGGTVLTRGASGDLWADLVIGQRDFSEINPNEVVADKVFNPGGIVVDNSATSTGKAYLWDSGNNRVLGLDLASCFAKVGLGTRCAAEKVLGQPSLNDYGACNQDSSRQSTVRPASSNSTICGVSDAAFSLEEQRSQSNMAVDSDGNLFVSDIENNRVIKYNNPYLTGNDTLADEVWGQADFSGNLANRGGNPSSSTISFDFNYWGSGGLEKHGGVAIDPQGNLWVADTANSRVLRFPKQGSLIAKDADIVLGQSDFTTATPGSGLNQLKYPAALAFDSTGKLYVADTGNNRVLVFSAASLVPGSLSAISATGTFGSDFAHAQPYSPVGSCVAGAGYTGAYIGCDGNPWEIQNDPAGRGIWTSETLGWNSRMRLWGFNGVLLKDISHSTRIGGSLGVDKAGNLLVTAVAAANDAFRFQMKQNGTYSMVQKLFSPPGGINLMTNRRFNLTSQGGMALAGDQLVVNDGRLLFWNGLSSLTNGKVADGFLRTSSTDSIKGFTDVASPGIGYLSASSDKLWAGATNKILVYQNPLVSAGTPMKTITSVNVLGGGTIDFSLTGQAISGIVASTTGNFVWVSQSGSHRVLRIKDPLTSSPVVDIILGQLSLSATSCNQNPTDPANTSGYATPISSFVHLNTLCYPGALGIDKKGNLYVSDVWHEISGNQRLLMFAASTFPDAPTSLIFAPNATKEFPRSAQFGTWQPAFDSTNRMVVGYNPYSKGTRRVDYFNDPTDVSIVASGQLNDFDAWPLAAAFDTADNLYVYEVNRGQVRIYLKPFVSQIKPATVSVIDPNLDSDGDGFTDAVELKIGTDPYHACGIDAWPPDLNNDGKDNSTDLLISAKNQATSLGAANYIKRYDMNADGKVNSTDLLVVAKKAGACKSTTPIATQSALPLDTVVVPPPSPSPSPSPILTPSPLPTP
jgi:hypothetical protein